MQTQLVSLHESQSASSQHHHNSQIYVGLVPKFTNWSGWSYCSASCGPGGQHSGSRKCTDAYENVDSNDPTHVMKESCYLRHCCPGDWTEWSDITGCVDVGPGPYKKTLNRTKNDHPTCKLEGRIYQYEHKHVKCSEYGDYGYGKGL